jgi:anti-sigma factor RsiW
MKHQREEQIEAYISRAMPEHEMKAFEAALAADPELRSDVRAYRIAEKAVAAQGQQQVRTKIKEIRRQQAPLPPPRITFADHIRFFYYSKLNRAISFALLFTAILIGGWWAVEANFCPVAKISAVYFIPPTEIHAMASPVLDYSQAQKASNFYSKGQLDSLVQMVNQAADPAVPVYYAAHGI